MRLHRLPGAAAILPMTTLLFILWLQQLSMAATINIYSDIYVKSGTAAAPRGTAEHTHYCFETEVVCHSFCADQAVLLPLTQSLYVKGKVADTEKVMVNIGTDYYVEVSRCR
jgi:hypothetical protein